MKKTVSVLFFLAALPAFAATTYKTEITCQQEEGDQWVEFGIVNEGNEGPRAIIVAHDVDDGSAKLIRDVPVSASADRSNVVYTDVDVTVKMTISRPTSRRGDQTADLTVLMDGPGSIQQEGMTCYRDSEIAFD